MNLKNGSLTGAIGGDGEIMTDDAIQRVLGKLEAGIENLSEGQRQFRDEWRVDKKQLFDGINNIAANGCAIGKQHTEMIKELKERPERLVGIGAAIASILGAVGSAFLWAFGKGHQ